VDCLPKEKRMDEKAVEGKKGINRQFLHWWWSINKLLVDFEQLVEVFT
jgi:hypothetical protein